MATLLTQEGILPLTPSLSQLSDLIVSLLKLDGEQVFAGAGLFAPAVLPARKVGAMRPNSANGSPLSFVVVQTRMTLR